MLPRISVLRAIEALSRLCLYEEQQEKGDCNLIQHLEKHERVLMARKMEGQQQQDIRRYFGSNLI